MQTTCSFKLIGTDPARLMCPGLGSFAAFSGNGIYRNKAEKTDVKDNGPLPEGKYYIVDKPVHGIRSHIIILAGKLDLFTTDRSKWFALYRDDEKVDDETFVNGVKRENIRLHPEGPMQSSEGCITLHRQSDFDKLATALRKQGKKYYSEVGIWAYGTIQVGH